MIKPILVVQGAQWGSEGKGQVAAWLCDARVRDVDVAIRTGSINAGHTVYYNGVEYKMQQLPTGWVNPDTRLVIGPGAYVHPEILKREIDMINGAMRGQDVRDRLFIDRRCGVHLPEHEGRAKDANRHHRMGATGKGCSECVVDKIKNRNNGYKLFAQTEYAREILGDKYVNRILIDTVMYINDMYDQGEQLLLEGTQGTLLDLHIGPYPFTTNRMTSASNWVAEAGLAPGLEYEVVLVARTYPIRVAGNSGPMSNEIEWSQLAHEINDKLAVSGRPNWVDPIAIGNWGEALRAAAADAVKENRYSVPRSDGVYDLVVSGWTQATRDKYRVAASELHRDAIGELDDWTISQLGKLFELTTVTRKLRRIARLSIPDLQYAIAVNRPSWVCLTFLNYEFPQLDRWTPHSYAVDPRVLAAAFAYTDGLSDRLQVPVSYVSTGPLNSQIISTKDIQQLVYRSQK